MTLNRLLILIPVIFFLIQPSFTQERNVSNQNQYWVGYSVTKKINKDWAARVYMEDRRFIEENRDHMRYIMGDATYKLNDHWKVTAGFMYFVLGLPSSPKADYQAWQREFRPYQKLTYGVKLGKRSSVALSTSFEQRIRMRMTRDAESHLEQSEEYFTYVRFRNRLAYKYLLTGNRVTKPLYLYAYNEYTVHLGNYVKGHPFDQNRLSAGLQWNVLPTTSVKLGYLNWYQEIATSTKVFKRDIITFFISQTF